MSSVSRQAIDHLRGQRRGGIFELLLDDAVEELGGHRPIHGTRLELLRERLRNGIGQLAQRGLKILRAGDLLVEAPVPISVSATTRSGTSIAAQQTKLPSE